MKATVKDPGELVRATAFALLLVYCLTSLSAEGCYIMSAVVLLVTQASRRLTFVRLQTAWAIGFLFIICREGLYDRVGIIRVVGPSLYLRASQFVCAANAALMCTWTLAFREPVVTPSQNGQPIQWRHVRSAGAVLVAMYALVFAVLVPAALQSFQVGRNTDINYGNELITNTAGGVGTEVLESVVSTMLPPLIVFYLRRIRRLPWIQVLLPCLPIIILHFFIGTRYLLLFSISGSAMVALAEYRLSPRILALLMVLATAVLLISGVMVKGLAKGFGTLELSDLAVESDAPTFHYEGVIPMLGMLMTYCDRFGQLHGQSMGGMLLFWIPRFLWPDKPTLLGYWLPRELGLAHGFSGGYSAAATFAADPFADFGFAGGIVACALVGFVWARVERWAAATLRQPFNPTTVIAGPLYGAAFFSVRSFDTTFIIVAGFVALGFAFSRYVSPLVPATASAMRAENSASG